MIKVLIERQVPSELSEEYLKVAREALQQTMNWPGYISGEVLHDAYDNEHRLVIATYRTIADWSRWYHSDERRAIMDRMGPMLEHEEKISIFEH